MKLTFLGTCSGTEPMAGCHHASVVIELGDRAIFLDAGEGCAYTAHLMPIDLLNVRHILISHPHMDHVGGLGNLLWTIRKLRGRQKSRAPQPVTVHLPRKSTYDGVMLLLSETEGHFDCDFPLDAQIYQDGVVLDEQGVRITAMHNGHLPQNADGTYPSFSFLIEAEGKKIVYSGDVQSPAELDAWADCDLMMIETGHHRPMDVAAHFAALEKRPERLIYTHHGRTILTNTASQLKLVQQIYGENARFAYDTMTVAL